MKFSLFPDNFFDCVYAISTIEHIGLKGRYTVTEEDSEGDFKTSNEVKRILRPAGQTNYLKGERSLALLELTH